MKVSLSLTESLIPSMKSLIAVHDIAHRGPRIQPCCEAAAEREAGENRPSPSGHEPFMTVHESAHGRPRTLTTV
ncbi:MAG TPA: hypothetical protein VLM79_24370 [Kofleriaceae bacterium]|nr:hypothetical protein [Kofleriaceae bacterium]